MYAIRSYYAASLEDANGNTVPGALTVNSCSASQVNATVAAGTVPGAYQVVVTNPDGAESPIGVTLTVGNPAVV